MAVLKILGAVPGNLFGPATTVSGAAQDGTLHCEIPLRFLWW